MHVRVNWLYSTYKYYIYKYIYYGHLSSFILLDLNYPASNFIKLDIPYLFPTNEQFKFVYSIYSFKQCTINIFMCPYLSQMNSFIPSIWYFTFIYLFLSEHFSPEQLPLNSNIELINRSFKTFKIDSSGLSYE